MSGWVDAAIAAQEEHIKRETSCQDNLYVKHRFAFHDASEGRKWQECDRCGVTRSTFDYDTKLASQEQARIDEHQALMDEQRDAAGPQDDPPW